MKKKKETKTCQKRTVREKIDACFGEPSIECRGWRSVTVGGAKKIEVLTGERVVVRLTGERLVIEGRELLCVSFNNGCLVVGGEIESVGRWRRES